MVGLRAVDIKNYNGCFGDKNHIPEWKSDILFMTWVFLNLKLEFCSNQTDEDAKTQFTMLSFKE